MLDETEASRGKLAVSREEFFADYDTPNKISIAVANECFDILVDLKPLTIINESGRGFIISDNPVTLYNLLYARRNYRINYFRYWRYYHFSSSKSNCVFLPLRSRSVR